jgi:hypothetical protein
LKFGNGINGTSLQADDSVAIYYLESNGAGNEISENVITPDIRYIKFASAQLTTILNDTWATNPKEIADPALLHFSNTSPSTLFSDAESVETIRNNAPDSVVRKLTISKTKDYERVVRTKFSNLISDVKAFNNFDYIKKYLEYFRILGLSSTNQVARILFNQTLFADSCNFNNMYVFIKPKIYEGSTSDYNRFLPPYINFSSSFTVLRHINKKSKTSLHTSELFINIFNFIFSHINTSMVYRRY